MKFLIVTMQNQMVPPEHALPLLDAFMAYVDKYKKSGHFEAEWSFSGMQGGGAIVEVDSLEELDTLIIEYPLGPFSNIQIYPLVDLEDSIDKSRQRIQSAMQMMSG